MPSSVQKRQAELSLGYASLALFGASIVVLAWFLAELVDRPEPLFGFVRGEIESATEGRAPEVSSASSRGSFARGARARALRRAANRAPSRRSGRCRSRRPCPSAARAP